MSPPAPISPAVPERGRLGARPSPPRAPSAATGRIPLALSVRRDGFLFVPPGVAPAEPRPLLVFFHGAGGSSLQAELILDAAAARRVLVVAVDSRGRTWDIVAGGLGPDVGFLDRALTWIFAHHAVQASRLAVSGFSDGASYALSLGRANGDLFDAILAFSPGFDAPPEVHGAPRVFVAHGTADRVLPAAACSRIAVPRLRRAGLTVEYREFEGGHTVPPAIARAALDWFVDG